MLDKLMLQAIDLRPRTDVAPSETSTDVASSQYAAPSVLSWEALEHVVQEKNALWYAVFGVAMALLIFAAFLMRSFLSGVVFALLGVLVLLYSERLPKTVRFQITKDALIVNNRRYPFQELDAFHIVETPHGPLALIRGRRLILPLVHVPLADQDPDTVQKALQSGIKEDQDLREPLADLLAHWVGF